MTGVQTCALPISVAVLDMQVEFAVPDMQPDDVGPARMPLQRDGAVQEILGPGDDLRAARRVVPLARRRAGQRFRAVERVVQAAPARIGGVHPEAISEERRVGDDWFCTFVFLWWA